MPPKSKFEGIDFSGCEVHQLTPDLEELGQGFRCKRGEFVTYWKKGKIKRECDSHTSRCWVCYVDNSLAAYITLLADKLSLAEPILKSEDINYMTFPAVKIGYLASDERAKRSGTRMVVWAIEYTATVIAPLLGVRFMTVDAFYDKDNLYDASGYYKSMGFRFANPNEENGPPEDPKMPFKTMYLDLKLLIDTIASNDLS